MTILITCHICVKRKQKPFKTPYDTIGVALMKEHLKEHVEKDEK